MNRIFHIEIVAVIGYGIHFFIVLAVDDPNVPLFLEHIQKIDHLGILLAVVLCPSVEDDWAAPSATGIVNDILHGTRNSSGVKSGKLFTFCSVRVIW